MKITWIRCESYEAARDYSRIVYLHEWDGRPFYWGKAHNSFFGGHKRKQDGLEASGRYNAGYRHWIEGCLRHGAKLYVGKLDEEALEAVNEVEQFLITTYGTEMNKRLDPPANRPVILHEGEVPKSISRVHATHQNNHGH